MMKNKLFIIFFAASSLLAADIISVKLGQSLPFVSIANQAQARVGRPATPRSVAGVARRTTRRTVRRTTNYVARLPQGCVVTAVNGANYWRCGGSYYAASGGRYVVVIIN